MGNRQLAWVLLFMHPQTANTKTTYSYPMFSNAFKALLARITLYPVVTLFIIILSNTMLNNSLHSCTCSKEQYQWGEVIFCRDTQVSKPGIFFSDKCKDRAVLQSWPLHSLHLFHQFGKLLVWMTAQWLLFRVCCKQLVFTQMCISLTHNGSQLVSSRKLPTEPFLCCRRWWCRQYTVSPLISHSTPSPSSSSLLLILHWEEDSSVWAP